MRYLHPTLSVLLMASASLMVLATPPGTRRTWDLGPNTWVKRIPIEKGSPNNGHPLKAEPAQLSQALASVRFVSGKVDEPLFAPTEALELGKALAEALSLAEPHEDLELFCTSKRDAGFLGRGLSVTARVFARDGKLNLLVHDARLDVAFASTLDFRPFQPEFGSRHAAGTEVLKAPGAEVRRADWLVLPLLEAPPQSILRAPAAPPAIAPSRSLEERLRLLKGLREQNLITEEEYAQRKRELLKET